MCTIQQLPHPPHRVAEENEQLRKENALAAATPPSSARSPALSAPGPASSRGRDPGTADALARGPPRSPPRRTGAWMMRQFSRIVPSRSQLPHRFCWLEMTTRGISTPAFDRHISTRSGNRLAACRRNHATRAARTWSRFPAPAPAGAGTCSQPPRSFASPVSPGLQPSDGNAVRDTTRSHR